MAQNQRGFAAMEPEQQKRIASKGGKAAHQSGHAHEWSSAEAAEAGRKGGLASHHDRTSFHRDTAAHHQSEASKRRSEGFHETAELHEGTAASHAEQADELEAKSRTVEARMEHAMDEPAIAEEDEELLPDEEESEDEGHRRRSTRSAHPQASHGDRG